MRVRHYSILSVRLITYFSIFAATNALAQTEHIAEATGTEMSDPPGFNVSNADLLQTSLDSVEADTFMEGTGGSGDAYLAENGEPTLRDGEWGTNDQSRGTAAVQNDESAEYRLDLTASPGGYTINAIDLYSNWGSGQGRDEIRVNVSFSLVGAPSDFNQVLVVAAGDPLFIYNPPTQTQGKLSLSGFSIEGVAAIRFYWPEQQENSAVGYSEIDVFGTSTGGDVDPPTLSSSEPARGATDVATTARLTLTFNEDVQAGTGSIDLRTTTPDASVETFDVSSSQQLSFDGRNLTINPTNLEPGIQYVVVVPSGSVDDLATNDFAGIPGLPEEGAFTFTTDATPPVLSDAEPLLNGLPTSDVMLQFDEAISPGSGNITLHLASDDRVLQTVDAASDSVSIDGNKAIVEISDLEFGTSYYLNYPAGALSDLSGNAVAEASDKTTIAFATVPTTLIHHWKFEEEATDSVGTHDGTLRGQTAFIEGEVGLALNVANAGHGMNVDQASLPATNFTLACWVNPADTGAVRHVAGTRRGNTQGAQLKLQAGIPTVHLQSDTNVVLEALEPILPEEWTHLAFTVDESNGLTLYVNGSAVATDEAGVGHSVVDNFRVGLRPDVITEPFSGSIDELQIYAEALPQMAIASLSSRGPEPSANQLIGHYRMDETEGNVMLDSALSQHGIYATVRDGTFDLGATGIAAGTGVDLGRAGQGGGGYAEVRLPGRDLSSLSISMWVLPNDGQQSSLVAKGEEGGTPAFALLYNEGTVFWFNEDNESTDPVGNITAGSTAHVVVAYTDTNGDEPGAENVRIYIDGVEVLNQDAPPAIIDNSRIPLLIGSYFGSLSFDGIIDDVQVYAKAVTAEDAAFLFANPGEPLPLPESDNPTSPEIVGVAFDGADLTLTWTSSPGETFSVFFSTDLENFGGDVDNDVAAAETGNGTEYTFPITQIGENPPRAFFRVSLNEPQ